MTQTIDPAIEEFRALLAQALGREMRLHAMLESAVAEYLEHNGESQEEAHWSRRAAAVLQGSDKNGGLTEREVRVAALEEAAKLVEKRGQEIMGAIQPGRMAAAIRRLGDHADP